MQPAADGGLIAPQEGYGAVVPTAAVAAFSVKDQQSATEKRSRTPAFGLASPSASPEQEFEPWLSGEAGLEVLKPANDDLLQRWPVSKRVNSS